MKSRFERSASGTAGSSRKNKDLISPKDSKALVSRMVTVLALLPVGIFAVFFPLLNGLPLFVAVLVSAVIISYEIFGLMEKRGYRYYLWVNSIAVTLSFVNFYLYGFGVYDSEFFLIILLAILSVFALIVMIIESTSGSFDSSMENIGISLFGMLVLGVFCPTMGLIKMMDMTGWMLAILFMVTWMADAGGLFVGKIFGRHKIWYLSSPNKTVEGYVGSFAFGIITAVILFVIQSVFALPTRLTFPQMTVLTIAVITASIIGDLGESTFKRWAHAKDSSDLLPGHGGFFDRFDSVIFSAPVFYVLMKFFGY